MSAKLLGSTALLALSGTLALGGCSSSTTDTGSTPATPDTTSSSTSGQECAVAMVTGESKNRELMALAVAQYEALDCAGDLVGQVKTLGKDQDLKKKIKAAGADFTIYEAGGIASLSFVDVTDRTSCILAVKNSPTTKSLSCGDL